MADPHDSSDDYVRGEMYIHEHQASYHLFNALTKWVSLHIAVLLVFLVLLTSTKAGFITAFICAAIVAVAGFYFLKQKNPSH
ncbi:aa3-type cytochrome c oxidase subunit IV [Asticcacaulis sp. EMRT-3]|uniref:aa3-type cytochrome c oxidase subunit IV n=1 Tax=Asticcacaulis sp. EMRT-3 TaxID=3040349 RepID=UPI0024AF72E4|nr:aa3-type cytochrome c oxidase subunit IV [Asticcacaulis sp. EMRT-3]MDI7774278.1 aa3-type cytochrome c oxidase subunit IV [Asticcacaulis sp. EMRT-3]